MKIYELDTPTLLINHDILNDNLHWMQDFANRHKVNLRPHTKTHKMPYVAKLQQAIGAKGIAVAKTGEAEVMADNGITDIMIANEIVGEQKLRRIANISNHCHVAFGADCVDHIRAAEKVFADLGTTAYVVLEVEVGEVRSGVITEERFTQVLKEISNSPHVAYDGIFGHDGNSYRAPDPKGCIEIATSAQTKLLRFAQIASDMGFKNKVVSYGSTPSVLCDCDLLPGITELRVGTYAFMDASQASVIHSFDMCAATVLATVISLPTEDRVILDVGAKGLTMQERQVGICNSHGKGCVYGQPDAVIDSMFDEHAIIHNKKLHDSVSIGQKIQIVPAHICPVVNLYDEAVFYTGDEVTQIVPILCRGKIR